MDSIEKVKADIPSESQREEWWALRGEGMTSAVGEYTPDEFWKLLGLIDRLAALASAEGQGVAPSGYDYVYHDYRGGEVIVRGDGGSWNGQEPIRALPYYYHPAPSSVPDDGGALARRFHEVYERLAPSFGYETRKDTRAFDPESANGKLMIAVCTELGGAAPAHPAPAQGVPDGCVEELQKLSSDLYSEHPQYTEFDSGYVACQSLVRTRINAILAKALAASPTAAQHPGEGSKGVELRESGWLVEKHSPGGRIEYMRLDNEGTQGQWHADSNKATRFARREDANHAAEGGDFLDLRIVEHLWVTDATQPSAKGEKG